MLKELHIKNYALIESLDIDLTKGFSVITGETGAGKSIILGALGLLQGQRSDAKTIKHGEKKCVVEGNFVPDNDSVATFFRENDLDYDDVCIIRRELLDSGKSRAFVNDTPVNLSLLKELSGILIDIHSQHQNLLLGKENFLLETLDAVAGNGNEKEIYATLFGKWKEAERTLVQLREEAKRDKSDTEYLEFQLQQLNDANLEPDELEGLEEEAKVLRHAEEIKGALYRACQTLDSDESPVSSALRTAMQELGSIENVYGKVNDLSGRINSCRIELEDITDEISRKVNEIEYDEERLTFVEDRLNTLYSLLKKHGTENIDELIIKRENIEKELNRIRDIDSLVEKAATTAEKCRKECMTVADTISREREKAARKVVVNIEKTLKELGMPHASLQFKLTPRKEPDASGNDCATLLFSANKDVPKQDVSLIASGGEISRLMLAVKAFISTHRNLPTVIFDEIDTGVSGSMAEKMAVQMKLMSANSQVICITHLPQIAAMGEQHFLVFKEEGSSTTSTRIRLLNGEERIMEIANMLSGEKITTEAVNNAKALLNR